MVAALALLAALFAAAPTGPPPTGPPPAPSRWVEDTAGFLSPQARTALDAKLESYERATGHQVIVWIGTSLNGADLADWAVRTFAAWKLGRKGVDDGLAIFVFAEDRKIDIEVGYGLEDRVPDAIASRIIHEVMVPKLRAGEHDGAITGGVDATLAAIQGQPWAGNATTPGMEPAQQQPREWWEYVGGAVVIVFFVFLLIRHPTAALWILSAWLSDRRGGPGGGWGSGGGGGFSGGGGMSGGGGARGGW